MTFRHKPIASVTELSLHYLDYWDLGGRLVALGGSSYYLIVGLGLLRGGLIATNFASGILIYPHPDRN